MLALCNTLARPTTDLNDTRCGIRVLFRAAPVLMALTVVIAVFVAKCLLLCGDIELNPGPKDGEGPEPGSSPDAAKENDILKALESAVNRLETKQDNHATRLENNMKAMEDNLVQNLRIIQEEQQDMQDNITRLEEQCYNLQKENEKLSNKIDSLENQSRRNNLLFFGVGDLGNGDWDTCERKVKTIIKDGMGIMEDINIERAHLVGKGGTVIVKFLSFKQRSLVLYNSRKLKSSDQYSSVFVREDFSETVQQKRKALRDLGKKLTEGGIRSKLRFDKLITDSTVYTYCTQRGAVLAEETQGSDHNKEAGSGREEGAVGGQEDCFSHARDQVFSQFPPLHPHTQDNQTSKGLATDWRKEGGAMVTNRNSDVTSDRTFQVSADHHPPLSERRLSTRGEPSSGTAGTRSMQAKGAPRSTQASKPQQSSTRARSPLNLRQRKASTPTEATQLRLDKTLGLCKTNKGRKTDETSAGNSGAQGTRDRSTDIRVGVGEGERGGKKK